jgi:hypothetical protein
MIKTIFEVALTTAKEKNSLRIILFLGSKEKGIINLSD